MTAAIRSLECKGASVIVRWDAGGEDVFPAVWLRDNCSCAECVHPGNGQRLWDMADVEGEILALSADMDADGRPVLTFAPDGHQVSLDPDGLVAAARARRETPHRPRLWGRALEEDLPRLRYDDVCSDDAARARWLGWVRDLGFAILDDVPTEPGMVTRVVDLFGYVRETNYGRLFDVVSVVNPTNLAYTGLGLGVHTDNPYRDPVPTLQLLHCLESADVGGDTVLVDGFNAAERLRAEAPESFAMLCAHEIPFRFRDDTADLVTRGAVIEVDGRGAIKAVRYNNRSVQAFDMDFGVMEAYYAAYRAFGRLLKDREGEVQFKAGAGTLFIVDNRRVMHGRTAFSGEGRRHLQGCYADRDGLLSTLAVLEQGGAA